MTENQRLEYVMMNITKENDENFGLKYGIKRSTLSNYKLGQSKIPLRVFERIKRNIPNLNSDWLLLGEGDILIDNSTLESSKPNLNEPNTISTKKNYEIKGEKNNVFDKSTVNEVQAEYRAESSKLQAENETLRRRVAELEGMVADLKEDKKTLNGQILFLQEELKKK